MSKSIFENYSRDAIEKCILNNEQWEKWINNNKNNIDFLAAMLELGIGTTGSFSDEYKTHIRIKQTFPQSIKNAIERKEAQYHTHETIVSLEQIDMNIILQSSMMRNKRFSDIIRILANHNVKEEKKRAKKNGINYPKEKLFPEKDRNLPHEVRNKKRQQISKQRGEFRKQIPSQKVLANLSVAEDVQDPDLALLYYFNAGRAYEKAINIEFKNYTQHGVNISHSAAKNRQKKIEYWGKYIFRQRQKYINIGKKKNGKAIELALKDAVKKYGKENPEDYDRRSNKYECDIPTIEKSIKEHIRSNYWHFYKKIHNIN